MIFILVLGIQNPDTQYKRVKRAVEYFNALPFIYDEFTGESSKHAKIIMSGGGRNLEIGKSAASIEMKELAIQKFGIDPSNILVEEKSKDTLQNIILSLELLKSLGYMKPVFGHSIVLCTSSYHIGRALVIAQTLSPERVKWEVIHTNETITEQERNQELCNLSLFVNEKLIPMYSSRRV